MSLPSPGIAFFRSRHRTARWVVAALLLTLGACSSGPDGRRIGSNPPVQGGYKVGVPYQINGVWYYPKEDFNYNRTGIASWYGHPFHGRTSASGERYDMNAMTAAHKTLPMPSLVEVTNLENGRTAVLRVNDRGPFVSGRIIDVSRAAAQKLGFHGSGIAKVRVRILEQESRQMKQLALANMNNRANELAERRQRQAESGTLVAAKPPEYRPPEYQPVARAAAQPPERPVALKAQPVESAGQDGKVSAAPPAKAREAGPAVASTRTVQKRGGIQVSDLPPSGGDSSGTGVYRPHAASGPNKTAGSQGNAGLGRVAGRSDHAVRPKASGIHTARPVTPQVAARHAAPSQRRTSELPGRIFVQAGAFRDRGNAYRMRQRLATIGKVEVVPVRVGGSRYFRVRVGPVATARQGNHLLARVVDAGYPRAQIVID